VARVKGIKWGPGQARQRTSEAYWREPTSWARKAGLAGRRERVFCASLADWLDGEVPAEWLADLLYLVLCTRGWLDWQLLTKRPEAWRSRIEAALYCRDQPAGLASMLAAWLAGYPPANVWVGTSVEDQARADERVPLLLQIPASVRFLSMEPLLGPVDLDAVPATLAPWPTLTSHATPTPIGWIIVGGESGPGARPFDVLWARDLVEVCARSGVPCFVKQMGARPVLGDVSDPHGWPEGPGPVDRETGRIRLVDAGHGGDWLEWPEALRVRQFPGG
jgi:protein gp37